MNGLDLNRLGNTGNRFQGEYKRVLCVCSAGLLRSPTIAWVLSNDPFNFNTRAVGCNTEYGFIQLDAYQLTWADEVVCAEYEHQFKVEELLEAYPKNFIRKPKVITLDIPDNFGYRDPTLCQLIRDTYQSIEDNTL